MGKSHKFLPVVTKFSWKFHSCFYGINSNFRIFISLATFFEGGVNVYNVVSPWIHCLFIVSFLNATRATLFSKYTQVNVGWHWTYQILKWQDVESSFMLLKKVNRATAPRLPMYPILVIAILPICRMHQCLIKGMTELIVFSHLSQSELQQIFKWRLTPKTEFLLPWQPTSFYYLRSNMYYKYK